MFQRIDERNDRQLAGAAILVQAIEQVIRDEYAIYNGDSCEVLKDLPDSRNGAIGLQYTQLQKFYCVETCSLL